MIVAVKIYCPLTEEFMGKGGYWNKKGKSWSCLKDAKLAICPNYGFNEKETCSEFWLFSDDGTLQKQPVSDYFIDYFERQIKEAIFEESRYKYRNALNLIQQYIKLK